MKNTVVQVSRIRVLVFGLVVFLAGAGISRIVVPATAPSAPRRVVAHAEWDDVRQFVRKNIACKATFDPLPGECGSGGFIEVKKSDGSALVRRFGDLAGPSTYQDRYVLRASCLPPTGAVDSCCANPPCEQRLCVEVGERSGGSVGNYDDLFAGASPPCPAGFLGSGAVWISCSPGEAVQAINFNTQEVVCTPVK